MTGLTRRGVLAGTGVGGAVIGGKIARAATFGNPDLPPQGSVDVRAPSSLSIPGPHDSSLADTMPTFLDPPPTDVGSMPMFWASFNLSQRRIQDGGWGRQVTQADFAISTEISGVNMRLSAGGIRELHWHQQAEWAIVTYGNCRITVLDAQGRPYVADVTEGDLWYFPAGMPHSLQGLGPRGAEFVLAFDNGASSEFNTLPATDWMAHTPPDVLAKNFGVPAEAFKNIPLQNRWIFQGKVPPSLDEVRNSMASSTAAPEHPFTFSLSKAPKISDNDGGFVQVADSSNFKVSKTVAAGLLTIRPGAMRTMHWHPNADEWQYYLKGTGRMTVFNAGPAANTANFHPGDIGYVKKGLGHYIENTGSTDLVMLAVFRSDRYEEVSFAEWLAHPRPKWSPRPSILIPRSSPGFRRADPR